MQTGDELSKRSKFVFCTWIGDKVKVMEKAKMGTDKALVKAVIEVGMMMMVMMAGMMVMVINTMMIRLMKWTGKQRPPSVFQAL